MSDGCCCMGAMRCLSWAEPAANGTRHRESAGPFSHEQGSTLGGGPEHGLQALA